jgi:hypothetical protein
VPQYVRTEIKNKTGVKINEYGEKIEDEDGEKIVFNQPEPDKNDNQKLKQQKKEYTPIKTYKPSGSLVYDDDILNKIENKFI